MLYQVYLFSDFFCLLVTNYAAYTTMGLCMCYYTALHWSLLCHVCFVVFMESLNCRVGLTLNDALVTAKFYVIDDTLSR